MIEYIFPNKGHDAFNAGIVGLKHCSYFKNWTKKTLAWDAVEHRRMSRKLRGYKWSFSFDYFNRVINVTAIKNDNIETTINFTFDVYHINEETWNEQKTIAEENNKRFHATRYVNTEEDPKKQRFEIGYYKDLGNGRFRVYSDDLYHMTREVKQPNKTLICIETGNGVFYIKARTLKGLVNLRRKFDDAWIISFETGYLVIEMKTAGLTVKNRIIGTFDNVGIREGDYDKIVKEFTLVTKPANRITPVLSLPFVTLPLDTPETTPEQQETAVPVIASTEPETAVAAIEPTMPKIAPLPPIKEIVDNCPNISIVALSTPDTPVTAVPVKLNERYPNGLKKKTMETNGSDSCYYLDYTSKSYEMEYVITY